MLESVRAAESPPKTTRCPLGSTIPTMQVMLLIYISEPLLHRGCFLKVLIPIPLNGRVKPKGYGYQPIPILPIPFKDLVLIQAHEGVPPHGQDEV